MINQSENGGLWSFPGIPHRGWTCLGVHDVRDGDQVSVEEAPYERCEMCGKYPIRFVHIMYHTNSALAKRVGCVCAGHMESPYKAQERERHAKRKAGKKARWLSRAWRTSKAGNAFLNIRGRNIGVHKSRGGWGYRLEGNFSKIHYQSQAQAKLALFDAMWEAGLLN